MQIHQFSFPLPIPLLPNKEMDRKKKYFPSTMLKSKNEKGYLAPHIWLIPEKIENNHSVFGWREWLFFFPPLFFCLVQRMMIPREVEIAITNLPLDNSYSAQAGTG